MSFLRYDNLGPKTSAGEPPPQPVTLAKSFPVPNGIIPIGQLDKSIVA